MPTLGLSQIVKNESHVIERMLTSVYPILDYVCIVDTGSTDDTKEKIAKFCESKNIKYDIYDRVFDNFENCRNFAMEKVKGKVDYAMWLDADEELRIGPSFDKSKLDKDLYMLNTTIGQMSYTRNELWKTSVDFKWYGPVHEFITPPNDKEGKAIQVTSGIAEGLHVDVHTDGGSWLAEGTEQKYKNHSRILEDYINYEDRDPRWIFYTAQSYHDSATIPNNREENFERLRRSMKYYKERVSINTGYYEERYYAQYRIGSVMRLLEEPWKDTMSECLKAYTMDPVRGESIKVIIDHYQAVGNWSLAYLHSKFSYETFHGKSPYPSRLLFVDVLLYEWRFLEQHTSCCFYTKHIEEGKKCFGELIQIMENSPDKFTEQEKARIKANARHFA